MKTDKFGKIIPINLYNNESLVKRGDIVIANMTEFSLTEGKVYVIHKTGMFLEVCNDDGNIEQYAYEYFDLYQNQKVEGY